MDTVKVIEVVETTLTRRGNGETNPIRVITQYWDRDGNLLAEEDPSPDIKRRFQASIDRANRLCDVIDWALGEAGEFPIRKRGEGVYWWRKELRRRAGLM